MTRTRKFAYQQLILAIERVDQLQQALLGDDQPTQTYEWHNQLQMMLDTVEEMAADEERESA